MTPTCIRGENFCVLGKFELELYRQGLVLVTGDNRDTDAASSNGAGKSTVFKAITWCLTGKSPDGKRAEALVRRGCDLMVTEVELFDGEKMWTARRGRDHGSPFVEIIEDETGSSIATGAKADEWLETAIGMDYPTWRAAVLYGGDRGPRFGSPNAADSQRKGVLHRVLGTGRLQAMAAWCRDQEREWKDKVEEAKGKALELRAELRGLDDFKSEAADWDSVRLGIRADLEAKIGRARRAAEVAAVHRVRRDELVAVVAVSEGAASQARAKRESLSRALKEASKASEEVIPLEVRADRLKSDLSFLSVEKCPTCSGSTDVGPALEHRVTLERELAELKSQIESFIKRKKAARSKARLTEEEADELQAAADEGVEAATDASDAEKAALRADGLGAQVPELELELEAYDEVENPWLAKREEALRKKLLLTTKATKLEKLAELRTQQAAHFGFWAEGYGPQGIPSMLFDEAMPALTESANRYLETLTDGDVVVEFDTTRELKSGKLRDEVNMTWVVEGTPDEAPSQGQTKKMEIAGDLAIMDLAASRLPEAPDLLMMDEALDGLDAEGRARVVELLRGLRGRRGTVFVVTHEPVMAEAFERAITVVKEGGVARLEVS